MRWKWNISIITSILILCGCATIDPRSNTEPRLAFGIVSFAPIDKVNNTTRYESKLLGFWSSESGFSVGYIATQNVSIPLECQIVFIIEDEDDLQTARHLVETTIGEGRTDVCVS